MQWLWASEAAEAAAHRSPSKPTSPKPSPFAKKRWLWASDETPSPKSSPFWKRQSAAAAAVAACRRKLRFEPIVYC